MGRSFVLSLLGVSVGAVLLAAQGEAGLQSGPKEGKFLPGPLECYLFNARHLKSKEKQAFHCLVCQYALNPAILVFVRDREPNKEKDAVIDALMKRLEEAVPDYKRFELRAGVVFLSPDAQSSATNPKEEDPDKLLDEAKKRDAVFARLSERAASFKELDVAVFPGQSPKGYNINPKAEVTILFLWKLKVVSNQAFAPGTMTEADIDKLFAKINDTLEPAKKKKG
jgi:hypothetical protein